MGVPSKQEVVNIDTHENNHEIKTAYVYRRVSSEEQARGGISLEIQKYDIEQYAQANGIKIIGDYEDAGISAGKPVKKRPALSRMLDDMERDKPDILLLWRLDRLWRRVSDYYDVKKVLDKIHCDFFCVAEQNYDTRNATGRLYINIKLSISENEKDQTSERLTSMFRSRTERGIVNGGTKTFGYDIVVDEKGERRYQINEEEAQIVREIFDYYVNCGHISTTTMWLRETHGIYRTQKSMRWFILGNSIYIGRKDMRAQGANYNDPTKILYTVENYCPAIIDQRTWEVTQSMLRARDIHPGRKKYDYAFSSLLRCARCGKPLSPYPTTKRKSNGDLYVYKCYRCPTARTPHQVSGNRTCTMKKTITEGRLEVAVLEEIKKQLGDHIATVEEDVQSRGKKNKSIQSKIDKLQTKLSRLNELYLDCIITREEYDRRSAGAREEIKELEASKVTATQEQVQQMKDTLEAVATFDDIYDTLSSAEKNVLFRNIIKYIELDTETLEMRIHFL